MLEAPTKPIIASQEYDISIFSATGFCSCNKARGFCFYDTFSICLDLRNYHNFVVLALIGMFVHVYSMKVFDALRRSFTEDTFDEKLIQMDISDVARKKREFSEGILLKSEKQMPIDGSFSLWQISCWCQKNFISRVVVNNFAI